MAGRPIVVGFQLLTNDNVISQSIIRVKLAQLSMDEFIICDVRCWCMHVVPSFFIWHVVASVYACCDRYLTIIYKKLHAIYLMLYKRYKTAKIKKYKHEHVLAYTFNLSSVARINV